MAMLTKRPWGGYLVVAVTFVAGLVAFWHTLDWYKKPIPGVLVDPDFAVSSVMLPSWDGHRQGLRFPDRVVWAEGHDLSAPGASAEVWEQAVAEAEHRGSKTVSVRVATSQGLRSIELRLAPLDPLMWWIYAGGLFLVGVLYLGAAGLAITVRPRGQLARSFAHAAVCFALFVLTVFDYHTSRVLVPLFEVAFCMVPFAALALTLRLPSDHAWLVRYPWLEWAMRGVGAALAATLVASDALGLSTLQLRVIVSVVFGLGLLASAITFVARFVLSRGDDRLVMRALFLAMVPGSLIVGAAALLVILQVSQAAAGFCVVPAFALIPVSSILAFVRHDFWGSRALLSRFATRVVITLACSFLAAALASGLAVAAVDMSMRHAVVVSSLAATATVTLLVVALVVVDHGLFRSRVEYKPSVEQLSEELTAVTKREQVASSVERTVQRWLPSEDISFVSFETTGPREERPSTQGEIAMGPHSDGPISIPARFRGTLLGVLRVGRKRGGALYSDEDLDLLRTIANQAAVALAHADRYAEVEHRRKQHAEIWRAERAAIVETLAAEMAHEIRYPINFFRSLFKRGVRERRLKAEEVDIGCEEVERLEGLVADLRRVVRPKLRTKWVPAQDLVHRSETLLRDSLGPLRFQLEVPGDLRIRCDADKVTQVLVNLMSNAIDAAPTGPVGVSWLGQDDGGQLVVWDAGEGFDCEPATIFVPLYTTKATGTGLGLPIAHRIVRAHRWSIDVHRDDARTNFTIRISSADISYAHESTEARGNA
jgi:signal transduction histidine kinase